jgi:DNA polymerase elongation subunit (family B)
LGYNSENFDWPYLEKRYSILTEKESIDEAYDDIRDILFEEELGVFKWNVYNKRNSTLKVGGAVEKYNQTNMYGKTILDGWHNIKKLQAIDKRDSLSLKWNVKHEKINKKNRVYVPGDSIGAIGKDEREYFFCDENGDWFVNEIPIETQDYYYKNNRVKRDENGVKYYGNKSKLYINTTNGPDNEVRGCSNVVTLNEDVTLFENSLYNAMKGYNSLVIPKKRFGIEYKGTEKYGEIVSLLKRIGQNFKNLNKVYSHLDFSKYEKVSGKYIIERYLLDDLWETVKLFEKTGQSSYMLGSWVMIGAQRVYTMGYASMWKIIITCWFYHKGLGVPDFEGYRKINGGLIGMFKAGYSKNVVKYDASSLYPSVKLAYLPAPAWDIMGITDGLLNHFLSTRLKYKALKGKFYKEGDFEKSKLYGILEQPLKIFINSYYGFLGAWTVSPFSDTLTAHGITAISRQVARHMIMWFEKRGFKAIYSHTDGINFIFPDNVDTYEYIGKGINWLVKKDKVYKGLEAYVSQYNDDFMEDKMGIDIDGIDYACINIAKSNVVHLKITKSGHEIDIVGGLIKKDTKKYIRKFLDHRLKPLLLGEGKEYIKEYIYYLQKINNKDIKGVDIADFVKIKTLKEYDTEYKSRMAVYELVKKKKIPYEPGSLFYYYNNGKQSFDFKEDKDKIGMFLVEPFNRDAVAKLENVLNEFDRETVKEKILKASSTNISLSNYSKPDDTLEEKAFIFSKKRMSINEMYEMGYDDLAKKHEDDLEDHDQQKMYEKTFYIDEIEDWDSIKIKRNTHKKYGLCLEVYMVNDRLNITNLPVDEHEDKVDYNVKKYIEQFYKAIEPLHLVFNNETRKMLINIKDGIKKRSEKWMDYVNKLYGTNYESTDELINEIDCNMINGIPLEGKEDNQQDKDKIMNIDPVEYTYWNDSEMHPYWFLNKKKIEGDIFYINQEKQYIYDNECDNPFAVCNRIGLIQHYAKNNFKAA